jgi:hypothetical protein
MAEGGTTAPALACWKEEQRRRRQAMDRFAVLRPHLEDGALSPTPPTMPASRSEPRSGG